MTERVVRSRIAAFARELGDPLAPFAILAEGNVSVRAGSGFFVKASGAGMRDAQDADFVRVELDPLMELIRDPKKTTDADVARAFAAAGEPGARRPSVESLLHAVCYSVGAAGAIAHSHPVSALTILSSAQPEVIVQGALFPDQIVVLGRHPLFVPYADPGLDLARLASRFLEKHCERYGEAPRVVYLQNHGVFSLGASVNEAMQITHMVEKSSQILLGTMTCGGPRFLTPALADRIDTRPDELLRRRRLADDLPHPSGEDDDQLMHR